MCSGATSPPRDSVDVLLLQACSIGRAADGAICIETGGRVSGAGSQVRLKGRCERHGGEIVAFWVTRCRCIGKGKEEQEEG